MNMRKVTEVMKSLATSRETVASLTGIGAIVGAVNCSAITEVDRCDIEGAVKVGDRECPVDEPSGQGGAGGTSTVTTGPTTVTSTTSTGGMGGGGGAPCENGLLVENDGTVMDGGIGQADTKEMLCVSVSHTDTDASCDELRIFSAEMQHSGDGMPGHIDDVALVDEDGQTVGTDNALTPTGVGSIVNFDFRVEPGETRQLCVEATTTNDATQRGTHTLSLTELGNDAESLETLPIEGATKTVVTN